jgi:hypothetical protein
MSAATNWEDAYRTQVEAIKELRAENADLRDTLDAVIAADGRAVDLWRAAHPGNELVIPDRAKLVGWLLDQNAELRKELDWKTERLKLLSNCLHNIDDLVKQAAASIFLDAIDATLKETQP